MTKSRNDIAWQKLFDEHKILEIISKEGHYEISASKINEIREARLMTKFDHRSQLPQLFSQHNLSILPTNRGGYIIGTFKTYYDFKNENIGISQVEFPPFLESMDFREITSESIALNCAFVTEILNDFAGEERLYPTVSGRMSSSSFDFKINTYSELYNIRVDNAQVEIDGGYEGDNSLNLIEAKNYLSDDFLIRQLYYPYRLWKEKIQKKVRPIFMTYSNGIFHLMEFEFTEPTYYNSILLIKQKKYALIDNRLNIEILAQLLETIKTVPEPEIPFPQADNFDRIINLCELISQNQVMSKEQYLQDFDFGAIDPRQHDYYTNAARYLGLVDKTKEYNNRQATFVLSALGKKVMNTSLAERQKEFIKLIISHEIFKQILKIYFQMGEMPSKDTIVEIMKELKLYKIESESTYLRRASTISGWISWIINQLEE